MRPRRKRQRKMRATIWDGQKNSRSCDCPPSMVNPVLRRHLECNGNLPRDQKTLRWSHNGDTRFMEGLADIALNE